MPLLIIAAIFTVLFALLGLLAWTVLYLFRVRNHGRSVLKLSLTAYICLLPVILLLVLPITFSHLVANASTRPQDRSLSTTPEVYGCQYSEVRFPSRDNLLLSGWLIEGESDQTPVVISHGLFRNRQEVLERACHLNRLGYPVLVFDLRCHGTSQRKTISLGYQERFDVLGAIDYLIRRYSVEDVVVAGVSMGAVASIFAAHESRELVEAVIADSPFDNLAETVGRHTEIFLSIPARPFSDVFVWNLAREGEFKASQLNTVEAISELADLPVLLLYGEDDSRMTAEVAEKIYDAIPSSRKELLFFQNAGHGGSFEAAPEEYVNCIADFLASSVD